MENNLKKNRNFSILFKLSKKISQAFFLISILILIYVYYRSEIIHDGNLFNYYLKYYIFTFGSVIFWGIVLKLKDETKTNIVLLASSLIVIFYLIELFITFILNPYSDLTLQSRFDIKNEKNFDIRTKYQFYADLKKKGVDVVPSFPPKYFINKKVINYKKNPFPFSGVSKKTTILCNESGKFTTFLSDRYGFNNPDEEWDAKQTQYILIGDSFVIGECVSQNENISANLRILSKKNVLNIGYDGNGPLIELATLKEYAGRKKPKKVLWFYYEGNDLGNLNKESANKFLLNYLKKNFSQNLISKQNKIDDKLLKLIELEAEKNKEIKTNQDMEKIFLDHKKKNKMWTTRFLRLKELRKFIAIDELGIDYDEKLFIKVLQEAKSYTESWGGEFYFIYLPEYRRYAKKLVLSHGLYAGRNNIINLVKSIGIPVVDMHERLFSRSNDPLSFFPTPCWRGCHYGAFGYKAVAKVLISELDKN